MKRKPGMKALALLLTAGMLFTGCGGRAGNTPEEEPETGGSGKTMGRYGGSGGDAGGYDAQCRNNPSDGRQSPDI